MIHSVNRDRWIIFLGDCMYSVSSAKKTKHRFRYLNEKPINDFVVINCLSEIINVSYSF